MIKEIKLKKGRDESVRRFHPWIFSGAVAVADDSIKEGDIVRVVSREGDFLAYGHYQEGSISVRILSFDESVLPEGEFWFDRIVAARCMRESLAMKNTTCYRLVHGEGDGLPGLIIDIYGEVAVIQAHSVGMFLSRGEIASALEKVYGNALKAVYDKSAGTAPHKAGLDLNDGYLLGSYSDESLVLENGHKFTVNWKEGQKTGFFLDQRDNRFLVGEYSKGRNVLNLFCYTGGFSIYALSCGAERVVSVDSSKSAIEMLERNVDANFNASEVNHISVCDDAIDYLYGVEKGVFDMMIVDPPAFAKHRGALNNALRAYRRLNEAAISKIARGGYLFTYSCSQVVDRNMFYLTVFSAAAATGRNVRILRRLTQPADHPVNIYHPEGEYLKGLLLYVE
ncbi:MAG: class I SAM-dependent rRNA methyltransferase [Alistipes sp.]|nr:class I SAM-dependent rRNA methyltransferase [Candidatus Minthomonas equi]